MSLQSYYITDRRQFPGNAREQEERLVAKVAECAAAGVHYIQLREKDLSTRALEELASTAVAAIGTSQTRLLINSRTDVALACGAYGVHVPSDGLPASEVRAVLASHGGHVPMVAVSAHSLAEVAMAEAHGADFCVIGPVFQKDGCTSHTGLNLLRAACHRPDAASPAIPVFALGGVDAGNIPACRDAGASGIAGIRIFQQGNVFKLLEQVRSLDYLLR